MLIGIIGVHTHFVSLKYLSIYLRRFSYLFFCNNGDHFLPAVLYVLHGIPQKPVIVLQLLFFLLLVYFFDIPMPTTVDIIVMLVVQRLCYDITLPLDFEKIS